MVSEKRQIYLERLNSIKGELVAPTDEMVTDAQTIFKLNEKSADVKAAIRR
jgi:hypothetical protein